MNLRENRFLRLYRANIGNPTDTTEIYGYWLFVMGLAFATLGIAAVLWGSTYPWGEPAFWTLRETGMVLAAIGLPLGLLGATFRLPLQPASATIGAIGLLVSAAAVVWFIILYPFAWPTAGPPLVLLTYLAGILVLGGAYTVVPHVATRERSADEARSHQPYYEIQRVAEGYMWQLFGPDGQLLAESATQYDDKAAARATINRLASEIPTAGVEIAVTEAR